MKSYDTFEVAELSGLSPDQVRALARDGLIGRRIRRRYRFGFQDLVLTRTARRLLKNGVGMARVRRALKALANVAGEDIKTTAVRVQSAGRDVVVEDRGHTFSVESGQGVLDFSLGSVADKLAPKVIDLKSASVDNVSADDWYDIGCDLESSGMLEQARAAYERVLEREPDHAEAHVNLGLLDADAGHSQSAEKHYLAALESDPGHALAWFNLGVLFEDSKRIADAIDAYKRSIQSDSGFADAHYNLSILLESSDVSGAFRHLSTYRRLTGNR